MSALIAQQSIYHSSVPVLSCAQTLALLEIIHSLLGIAGGGAATVSVQVLGRNLVLFGVLKPSPPSHHSVFLFPLILSWSVSDLIRYPMYVFKLLQIESPQFITSLRYSAFLALYPMGIASEIGIVLSALEHIKLHDTFGVVFRESSPKIAFNFYVFCLCGLASYLYFGPLMLHHMWKQRQSHLNKKLAQKQS